MDQAPSRRYHHASVLRWVYLVLSFAGAALPWFFLGRFFAERGVGLSLFFRALAVNDVATGFALDLAMVGVGFLVYAWVECHRLRLGPVVFAVVAIATLAIGPSCGIPLFFYARETRFAAQQRRRPTPGVWPPDRSSDDAT